MVFGESEELEIEIFSTKQERCWIGSIGLLFFEAVFVAMPCVVSRIIFEGGGKMKEEIVD